MASDRPFDHGAKVSRLRKRRRRRSLDEGAFQAINITPFTDVLLVLLIIFLIAGSSLAPTGLEVEKLSSAPQSAAADSAVVEEGMLWVSEDGALSYLKSGKVLSPVKLSQFDRAEPINLSAHPRASMSTVVRVYDELLNLGYSEVSLAAPQESLGLEP